MNQSQASQDLFVLHMSGHKNNGTFVEIGANHPIQHSNTYVLEHAHAWRGLMVEFDESFEPLYKQHRQGSTYYIGNAVTAPYEQLMKDLPDKIDYLQIDLDVNNRSTLDTLMRFNETIFDRYTFGTVTFEHDIYSGDFFNTRAASREVFKRRGYVLMFPDVQVGWVGRHVPFEDWYVHPDIVSHDLIDKHQTSESLFHKDIISRLRA